MGENGLKTIRTQKYKSTTDSNHTVNIAPNLLDPLHGSRMFVFDESEDFSADGPSQKCPVMVCRQTIAG